MADIKGFSHITVTADDDDDVVVQAGAVEVGTPDEAEVPDADPLPAVPAAEPTSESPLESDLKPEPDPKPEPEVRTASGDDYHETTLEDLQGAKMSTTQKAVIVVALLGVVAFAIWYLFGR